MDGDVIAEEFGLGGGEEKGRERKSQAHRARGTVLIPPHTHTPSLPTGPFGQPLPQPPPTGPPRELVPPFPSPVSREIQMFGPSSGIAQPRCPARCFLFPPPRAGVCAPRLGTLGRGTVLPPPPCQHLCRAFSRVACNTRGTAGSFPLACPCLPRRLPLSLGMRCIPASPERCGMQGYGRA